MVNQQNLLLFSIQYLRDIEGKDLAARSVEEMRMQGLNDEKILTEWYTTMKNIFPDVKKGSELTAIFEPGSIYQILCQRPGNWNC